MRVATAALLGLALAVGVALCAAPAHGARLLASVHAARHRAASKGVLAADADTGADTRSASASGVKWPVNSGLYWYPDDSMTKGGHGAYPRPDPATPGKQHVPFTRKCQDRLNAVIHALDVKGADAQRMIGVGYWGAGATDCTWASSGDLSADAKIAAATALCSRHAQARGPTAGVVKHDNDPGVCAAARIVHDAKGQNHALSCMAERQPAHAGFAGSCKTCQGALPAQIAAMYTGAGGVPAADSYEVRVWENGVVDNLKAMVKNDKKDLERLRNKRDANEKAKAAGKPIPNGHPQFWEKKDENIWAAATERLTAITAAHTRCTQALNPEPDVKCEPLP